MFKSYIRTQPAAVQLMILLSFWSALKLLFLLLMPFLLTRAGISMENYANELFNHPNLVLTLNMLNSVFTFLLPAAVFVYLADPKPLQYLGLEKPQQGRLVALVTGMALVLIPVAGILGGWIKDLNLGNFSADLDEQRMKMLEQYIGSGSIATMLLNVVLIGLVPAICEEVFFRGVVQRFAHTWLKKWWLSVGVSALIFAFAHASISEFIPITIAGFVLGWVYYRTGNLWLAILLHFLHNGLQVVLAYVSSGSGELDSASWISVLVFSIAALILLVCLQQLQKTNRPLPSGWSVVYKEEPADTHMDKAL